MATFVAASQSLITAKLLSASISYGAIAALSYRRYASLTALPLGKWLQPARSDRKIIQTAYPKAAILEANIGVSATFSIGTPTYRFDRQRFANPLGRHIQKGLRQVGGVDDA